MAAEKRGSIAFFSTYRPPVPLDIYSCQVAHQCQGKLDDVHMTDGRSYNYNGMVIPVAALKTILKRPSLASQGTEADVDSGRLSGMIFVSERSNLEILHIALRFKDNPPKVFSLADIYGTSTFSGVRMEDSPGFSGDYLIFVSTKEPAKERRQPWTAVYKTNLKTGRTDRLTPTGQADLSPSVSPSGKQILVATFQGKGGWDGEIENLKTSISVMNIERPFMRKIIVNNGGWPSWGSDKVIFFHRKDDQKNTWGVYQANITTGVVTRVTPDNIDAMTPAAIDASKVAVATIRKKSGFSDIREEAQYRHIEIFDTTKGQQQSIQITRTIRGKADHFNPFVIDGGKSIGYHRCRNGLGIDRQFQKLASPLQDVGLFRVTGVFPTFTKDGSRLAFVDNEFKGVWVADKDGMRLVYEEKGSDSLFSPVWNQNPNKDTLYVCAGPSFNQKEQVQIRAITHVSRFKRQSKLLTNGFNNAFPSSSPDGTRLVFRSTRRCGYKNLYIMEDAEAGELEGSEITPLTDKNCTDTHCQWSPNGDWIVFSSTRDKPRGAPPLDNGLDPGYFAVFLVNANNKSVVIRVLGSGNDLSGHVNHPFFSPDGKSLVVTSDLAAVSADPISLPLFVHSVRPYGDIFSVDINLDDINKSKNVKEFKRITHSRYENATATWTLFSTKDPNTTWNMLINKERGFVPRCPYVHPGGGESWHMAGHLFIPKRCC